MVFTPNDSPLAGTAGVHLTGTKIGERLTQEADTSVSLRVHTVGGSGEAFEVQARGELQLGLLIGELNWEFSKLKIQIHLAAMLSANFKPPGNF